MGYQFNAAFNLIYLSFFRELTFEIRFLITRQLLGNAVKPFIDSDIIGIELRDAFFVE